MVHQTRMIRPRRFPAATCSLSMGTFLSAFAGKVAAEPATDPLSPLIAPAPDSVTGHLQLHAGPVFAVPFARLTNRTTFRQTAELAGGIAADLGLGIDRNLAIGGAFQWLRYRSSEQCSGCDPSSFGFGAFARYHLVQGARFDPWGSLGVGYRSLDAGSTTYSGIEWLRLTMGGDWYALSEFGLGPYIELDLGTFTKRPSETDAAVYANFALGLNLVFDVPGK